MIPRLSIIVCTYNRGAILNGCLESLRDQDVERSQFEVIVVDNNSTDGTGEQVARYLGGQPQVRYVFEPIQGLSYARNRGAGEADAPYLTYIDDDTTVPRDFVKSVLEVIASHAPDIVGGPIFPFYTSPKPSWFRDEYETRQYADASGFSTTCGVSGSNFTIRRELVEHLGGFDVQLGMKGDEQGFGEDRALLLAYRRQVPANRQRVYYSLNCRISHWVAPYKLRLTYRIWRQFEGGLMNVRVMNRAATTPAAVAEFTGAPRATLRYLLRQYRQSGVLRTDYTEILLTASFHFGIFVGILRDLPSRLRATRRKHLDAD